MKILSVNCRQRGSMEGIFLEMNTVLVKIRHEKIMPFVVGFDLIPKSTMDYSPLLD